MFKKYIFILIVGIGFYLLFLYYPRFISHTYPIVNTYPHQKTAFTEGLILDDGILYESTGLYGHSVLIQRTLNKLKPLKIYHLPNQYFGEGITILNNHLYQLTYHARKGFIYNKNNFYLEKTFPIDFEGWGLTTNGKYLIASDGTNILHVIDPKKLKEVKKIAVTYDHYPVLYLNELEYLHGKIFANILNSPWIVVIDIKTGKVTDWIHIENIIKKEKSMNPKAEVANGIAYDAQNKSFLLTGKYWSKIYVIFKEIKLENQDKKPHS